MDQFSPLILIEQYAVIKTFSLYILSYHLHPCFIRSPLRSLDKELPYYKDLDLSLDIFFALGKHAVTIDGLGPVGDGG